MKIKLLILLAFFSIVQSFEIQQILNYFNPNYYLNNQSDWLLDLDQYKNFKIIRINLKNQDINYIKSLNYPVWESNSKFIDLKIHEDELSNLNCEYQVIIDDLPQTIYETYPNIYNDELEQYLNNDVFNINEISKLQSLDNTTIDTLTDLFFKEYRPLNTIYSWLDLIQESYPDLVNIEWLGTTYEGRDIKAIHLSSPLGLNPKKKTIVITSGVHAREWVSVSTSLFIISNLLARYNSNKFYKKETFFLNYLDFLIIPVFNPDGYDYTWNSDRLWRKNRQETYLPRCFGIDIDHSFGYHWQKSEDFPCGESYSGEIEFEAIEAQNINNYINITKNEHDIYGYIDLHSYTQKVLYPYAYSCTDEPRDAENLIELAYGIQKKIRLTKGKIYEVLPACEDRGVDWLPGLGAGSSLDYMYHNRAHWAFQLKLRDTGSHGFLLPSSYITPVGKEIYNAIKYFCEFILNPEL